MSSNPMVSDLEASADLLSIQLGGDSPFVEALRKAATEIGVLQHTVEASTLLALRAASQSVDDREIKDGLQAENSRLHNKMVDMGGPELREYIKLFELRWNADMRAIEMWRTGHPERELIMPDHADLVTWLLEQLDAVNGRNGS